MATINKYDFSAEAAIVPVTLGGADDVTLNMSRKSTLVIENATGGALTLNVIGGGATSTVCPGVGTIDLSGGKDFAIPDASTQQIPLNTTYKEWLGDGVLAITGGTGATAYVLEV